MYKSRHNLSSLVWQQNIILTLHITRRLVICNGAFTLKVFKYKNSDMSGRNIVINTTKKNDKTKITESYYFLCCIIYIYILCSYIETIK